MTLNSHQKRIISGLCLAAVLATCLILGGWPLRILVCLAALAGLWEFGQMFWPGFANLPDKIAGLTAGLLICLLGAYEHSVPVAGGGIGVTSQIGVLGLLAFYTALRFMFRYGSAPVSPGQTDKAEQVNFADHALLLFAVLYLPLSLQLVLHLSLQEQMLILLAAVGSDTGAYYTGGRFGKHKIWPRVSPKKSWEGAGGGLCAAMIILAVYAPLVGIPGLEHLAFWQWGIIGLLLSLAAQAGDFFESALKRSAGVKDSSNLIPGHGGLLDRLDSIVFAVPVYMFLRLICLHIAA
ncbi:MAG: phosphatidate cytidylyltransferase [Deltaproteobacteria bacterium]|nr:phosphatidate cytidylyltransferase [Deltaproteobacteria bacterium]